MKKTTKVKKSKVKTLFSPTAITTHISSRLHSAAGDAIDNVYKLSASERAARNRRSSRARRIRTLLARFTDKVVLGQLPASLEVIRDFKRQVAALR